MSEINTALLDDFIDESKEHLDEMESLLLQLSGDLSNIDLLNDIFRTMHNVKGASQITGLDRISRLSHRLEDLLDLLRQGQIPVTADIINMLISGRDRIAQLVSELAETKQELSTVDELVDQVNDLIEGGQSTDQENNLSSSTGELEAPVESDISNLTVSDEEKNDEELFTIYFEQLKQQFTLLSRASSQFKELGTDIDLLNKCHDAVDRLRSSANYMGYDDLVELFDHWGDALINATEELSTGEVSSLDFMESNLNRLMTRFPLLVDSQESGQLTEPEPEPEAKAKEREVKDDDITSSVLDIFNQDTGGDEMSEETSDIGGGKINSPLLNDFIDESRENLEEMELLLVRLGTEANDLDILNEIFRTMHNIKGASQLTGLDRISRLAHRLEDLLDLLRQQELSTDDSIVELLIAGRDRIVILIGELEQSEQEISSVEDLIDRLSTQIQAGASVATESPVDDENTDDFSVQTETEVEPAFSFSSPRIEISNFDEEHDQELFNIFIVHLRDQLASMASHETHLEGSADQQGRLKNCVNIVTSLYSSANYMGYEELLSFYQQWIDELEKLIQTTFQGEQVSLEFLDAYPHELGRVFPQIKQELGESRVAKVVKIPEELPPVLNPIVSKADESTSTTGQESELFDRMNSALESSLQKVSSSEHETLNEVFDELVSVQDEGVSTTAPKSIQVGRSASSVKSSKKAKSQFDQRGTDRRDDDRRDDDRRDTNRRKGEADKKVRKSVRVDAEKIDVLMNQVGELVVDRSYFYQLFNEMRELQQHLKDTAGIEQKEVKLLRAFTYRLSEAISGLGRTSNELQEGVMKMRMLPVSHLFNRYPRLVHDLTGKLEKKVNLILSGEETELDRMIVEEISDPLIHIIRNSIDHGIESPEERVKIGKPEEGKLILKAFQESNHIVIQVTDDGRGLNPEKIKKKAVSNGLYTEDEVERLKEHEVFNLILMPGFSTADQITGTSGRGVGMDVVKKNIEKLNGTLDIDSKLGKGTQMRLKIPLTLAIINALMVRVGGDMFTIPLANVDETVRISQDDTSLVEGVEVIYLRGVALPVFRLSKLFKVSSDTEVEKSFVVIVNTDGQRVGFVVDELIGQEEVVIKPLEDYVQERSGFSGATVIGDGRISLILDIYELVKMTTRRQSIRHKKQAEVLKRTKRRVTDNSGVESDRLH